MPRDNAPGAPCPLSELEIAGMPSEMVRTLLLFRATNFVRYGETPCRVEKAALRQIVRDECPDEAGYQDALILLGRRRKPEAPASSSTSEIGRLLSQLRAERGDTIKEMAERSKVSRYYIDKISYRSHYAPERINAIADAYGVTDALRHRMLRAAKQVAEARLAARREEAAA